MSTFTVVLFCVLVAGISATHLPFGGSGVPPKIHSDKPEPRRCCLEPYFTYEASDVVVSAPGGVLGTEFGKTRGAYDSIAKKIGIDTVETFPNGTEDIFKYIADYETGESYIIFTHEGEKMCVKLELTEDFPYGCLSDEATYVGSTTLGNRALEVEVWSEIDKSEPPDEYRTLFSIRKPECIEVGYDSVLFDADTGHQIEAVTRTVYDYNLGICDRDYWFKLPAQCEDNPERVHATQKIPKRFRQMRGLHGKRLFK